MKPLLVILTTAILTACATSTVPPPTPEVVTQTTPSPQAATATPSAATPPDEAFIKEIYHRLDVDDTIPDAGRQATISLFMGRPTALFPDNRGLVLVYEVFSVPPTQEETTQTAVMLVGTAVSVAADRGVALNGVEVIFYANATPFVGFRAISPWGVENIQAAPLAEGLRKQLEEKGSTPELKPTLPLWGG